MKKKQKLFITNQTFARSFRRKSSNFLRFLFVSLFRKGNQFLAQNFPAHFRQNVVAAKSHFAEVKVVFLQQSSIFNFRVFFGPTDFFLLLRSAKNFLIKKLIIFFLHRSLRTFIGSKKLFLKIATNSINDVIAATMADTDAEACTDDLGEDDVENDVIEFPPTQVSQVTSVTSAT